MTAWIRVDDSEKPKIREEVIIAAEYFVTTGFYENKHHSHMFGYYAGDVWHDIKKVTHWMPLPEMPND